MAFTSAFHFAKPAYQTLRYDLELNLNFDLIEAALLGFPSADPPGSATNYPDVVPTNGMKWLNISDGTLRIYYDSSWQIVHTFT
jgi:hypothetical protein